MNNDRDNVKLDIISGIDEDIIERNSARRYKLSQRKRSVFARRYAIIAVAAILAVCLLAGAGLAAIAWLGDDEPVEDPYLTSDGRKVPIYQGMTVSKNPPQSTASVDEDGGIATLSLSDRPAINIADPFGNLEETGGIAEAAKGAISIQPSNEKIYYAEMYEDIYVTIHINNPDSVEILSFTLNGKKYSSYMFEEGSNLEKLVLKCNVGGVGGILEYTIDAIKYIDGTEIKDVRMEGDRTVKVGVYTKNQPSAEVSSVTPGFDSLRFTATVNDVAGIIRGEDKVYALIYDGEKLLDKKPLPVGHITEIEFTGLSSNTIYQYAIAAAYDDLSGVGENVHIIYKNACYTEEILAFDEFTVTDTTLDFHIAWAESISNKTLISSELWHDDSKIMDLGAEDRRVSGLLSGEKYTLILQYYNGEMAEKIEVPFRTVKNATPTVSLKVRQLGCNDVHFEINESDSSNVGSVERIELMKSDGEIIVADDLNLRKFEDLSPNTTYRIRVTYTYDLNDGNGPVTITRFVNFATLRKVAPSVLVAQRSVGYDWVEFTLNVGDPDGIYNLSRIEIVHGTKEPVVAESNHTRIFTDLLPGNTYTIKVHYTYDLGEGDGPVSKTASTVIFTRPYIKPALKLSIQSRDISSVSFNLVYTDQDSLGQVDSIELWLGDELVETAKDLSQRSFTGLAPCGLYTIIVNYSYDLRDGAGVRSEYQKLEFCTQSMGLEIMNGVVTGIGTCKDSVLYVNMPIAKEAFCGDLNIEKVILGEGVTSIGAGAFASCEELYSVTLPSCLKQLPDKAFENCLSLEEINIPEGITRIGVYAFVNCESLNKISFPSTLMEIDDRAFENCYSIEEVRLPAGVIRLGVSAFERCRDLVLISLPEGLTSIGDFCFYYCDSLEEVVIPEGITLIREGVFQGCTKLESVTLPSTLKAIGANAFADCYMLSGVILPDGLTTIEQYAFFQMGANISKPDMIAIPASVTSMGNKVFEYCYDLTVYVSVSERPSGWRRNWNGSDYPCTVVWGA